MTGNPGPTWRSTLIAPLVVVACAGPPAQGPEGQDSPSGRAIGTAAAVTPVAGPSWLHHLGLTVGATRMGEMGGTGGVQPTPRREPDLSGVPSGGGPLRAILQRYLTRAGSDRNGASALLDERFELAGADLYRLSCQSCHGLDGEGSPPEINSLLGPVQGTSPEMIAARMKERGLDVDPEQVTELAAQAAKDLRSRLRDGGEKMPPFPHLQGDEVEALIGYLEHLAGVPPTRRAGMLVPQSAARVGEHVVKGTCHICHDATGPGRGHGMMMRMRGSIPSLASMPEQDSLSAVLRQVQYGSTGMMRMMGGETMPAYPYLTEEEVAAAYLYLADFPPRP